ncbi:hypothetical protein H4R18_002372 [Coemansia javaensis]|uniref:Uncharacterized protein n=1 Tax=Coemansia javaensis TaxID=2761396 RepID=A0A9W8HET5_9FUNG|nr:hypothetical protein H4R18_002372 [Coemansia javaensis]
MPFDDNFCTLSRTLCNSTHKSVLIKNAFQCQQELSKIGVGSPRGLTGDMTLFGGPSIWARMTALQPLNDPFVVDNIFKSPTKRRRGLLSWGAPPDCDPCGDRLSSATMLWGFSRHVRARNRRRSIMGSKYSLSSIRRRRLHASTGGDHVRSASDPTSALSPSLPSSSRPPSYSQPPSLSSSSLSSAPPPPPPLPQPLQTMDSPTYPATPTECHARPFIARTPLPGGRSPTVPALFAFPKLSDAASIQSPSECRLSDSFSILPARPCGMSSTLRGVPGHPTIAAAAAATSIGDLGLRGGPLALPAPVLLRDDRVRTARCTSMPCAARGGGEAQRPPWAHMPARVVFDPTCREMARWPFAAQGSARFGQVKNSLEIRQPAPPCTRTPERRLPQTPPAPDRRLQSPLPPAVRFLRWIAICGGGSSSAQKH